MNDAPAPQRDISAPVSIGELIDRICILEIKSERIADRAKLRNVEAELRILRETRSVAGLDTAEMQPLAAELKAINERLWDIENEIRELEARQDFSDRFVALARNVYLTNDRRARLKQQISLRFGSRIVEEKSYSGG
ncbi:MAG: DUF6165 family protein [Xanthobacteraceae bacterium]